MPRLLSAWQGDDVPEAITVALLLPLKLQQVCKFCAPAVRRKTKGFVLVDELPSPTAPPPSGGTIAFICGNAFSKCVPPEPRERSGLFPVSSSWARFCAAVWIAEEGPIVEVSEE